MKYFSMEETAALCGCCPFFPLHEPSTQLPMIQKRIQYYSPKGITWSNWFSILAEDSELPSLRKTARSQLGTRLLNEYRLLKQ